jgi:hypothetical protein
VYTSPIRHSVQSEFDLFSPTTAAVCAAATKVSQDIESEVRQAGLLFKSRSKPKTTHNSASTTHSTSIFQATSAQLTPASHEIFNNNNNSNNNFNNNNFNNNTPQGSEKMSCEKMITTEFTKPRSASNSDKVHFPHAITHNNSNAPNNTKDKVHPLALICSTNITTRSSICPLFIIIYCCSQLICTHNAVLC